MKRLLMALVLVLSASIFLNITFIRKFNNEKKDFSLGNSISIMVYDNDLSDYVQSNTIPIGSYKLNEEKSICSAGGTVTNYNNLTGKIDFNLGTADECYIYFEAYDGAVKTILDLYKGQGTAYGNGKLYLHDSTLANSAADDSYRFAGTDPDNYACFEGETCNDDHKYRIIGIFGENLKVIKKTSVGNKAWNTSNSNNTWEDSSMELYLNNEWISTFIGNYLVDEYEWHVGGYNAYGMPKTVLDAEMSSKPVIKRKVGLMYMGDYGYAAENKCWKGDLSGYCSSWISGSTEWTISRYTDNVGLAYIAYSNKVYYFSSLTNEFATRPCFYLNSKANIKSGTGSNNDPWILGI